MPGNDVRVLGNRYSVDNSANNIVADEIIIIDKHVQKIKKWHTHAEEVLTWETREMK